MNYSAIWNDYEKIMTQKMVKTADKDKSYDIKVPSAGENMPVEKSGYDLIEGLAHPEQVQVGESQLNDAIVERDTDTQRIMVDVALRNPRGVLAQIMNALIKTANALEANPANLKIADEIDEMLNKLAQQEFYNPEQTFEALVSATQTAVNELKDIHWGSFFGLGAGGKPQEAVENFTTKLQRYLGVVKSLNPDQKKKWEEIVSGIILTDGPGIKNYVTEYGKKGLFGPADALKAIRDLIEQASVSAPMVGELNTDKLPSDQLTQKMPVTTIIPSVKPEKQTMPLAHSGHNYSVGGPSNKEAAEKVEELQRLVGADPDGKFGPQTFAKVMEVAQKEGHTGLGEYMHSLTLLQKGYENWDLNAVIHAILAIKRFNQTKQDPFEKVDTQPAVEALRQKYPKVQVYNNQIYPFGYGGVTYALNPSNISYLANAPENLASKYIKEQSTQDQLVNTSVPKMPV